MSAPPYQKLFWGSYHKHTAHLSHAREHGAYLLLIGALWNNEGRLPDDDETLAGYAKLTLKEWQALKPKLMPLFRVSRGKLTQKRVTEDLAKYRDTSGKRKEAGKAGGLASRGTVRGKSEANASFLPTKPEPEPDTHTDVCVSHARTSRFEDWWAEYPGAVAKPLARKAYEAARQLIGGDDPDAVLIAGLRRTVASSRWADPTYTRPNPAKWLAEERWNDREAPAAREPGKPPPAPPAPISAEFLERRLSALSALKEAANA